jgi:hypothetical protein
MANDNQEPPGHQESVISGDSQQSTKLDTHRVWNWLTFYIESANTGANMQRAIELARILNRPQNAQDIHSVSQELQRIQLSGDGWQVAEALLNDREANIRFYGALTYQIKLNKEAYVDIS